MGHVCRNGVRHRLRRHPGGPHRARCSRSTPIPASSKATGYWFPRGERALATSIFDAAAKFSNVIGVPLVAVVVVNFGWRWGFGVTGILSLLYFLAFVILYRDPSAHSRLSAQERDYIRSGGATPEGASERGEVAMLGYLLRNLKVWGLTIGFAAYGCSFYLFLTWLPDYLVNSMHMNILKYTGFCEQFPGSSPLSQIS